MKITSALLLLTLILTTPAHPQSSCTTKDCHQGIEQIRAPSSEMMKQIVALGEKMGDPEGCILCHGGNATVADKDESHKDMLPDPGSPWVNERSCGICHEELIRTQWQSLMMTEAGKIQGTSWSFGSLQGYNHGWGNYDVENPDDPSARRGTDAYRAYMEALREKEPGAFPDRLVTVPEAPDDLSILKDHPEQAAFTYLRTECERCHLAVRGRERRGSYRGMGCSACHIPYSNEGLYEGGDQSIPHDKPRHLLVHTIQSSRDTEVAVHGKTYTGIPVETCTTCHDRGKRIGVTYQGLMESAYTSPFTEGGGGQLDLHTKHYLAMTEDIHYQRGMMCQDCHTSIDVHGDGFLAGTNLAQVQIECADCHGTPEAFPWELPLGFGDEFEPEQRTGPPRGVATSVPPQRDEGKRWDSLDGYLLTARGNPFPEVVRKGDVVVVHTAGGKEIELKPLKLLSQEKDLETEPLVAMKEIACHLEEMECYACHATWAPQCYGCHLNIDYSEGKRSFDWVKAGHRHGLPEHAAEAGEKGYDTFVPGHVTEQRSYMRFEDPALGVNGEGRVTPVIPGCQPSVTVIGPDGETILLNHIFRTPPDTEGAGAEGQLCIDMSPGNPHTNGRARTCESCHVSDKALGHGISGGTIFRSWDQPVVVDLMTADGEVLPKNARTQIEPISGLEADWSRFVTEDGRQLMTVGHHFSLSRPLNNDERSHMSREQICLSCHEEIPAQSLAVNILHHMADAAGALPKTEGQHRSLVNKILLFSAWGQVGGGAAAGFVFFAGVMWFYRRRRLKSKQSK